MPSLVLAVDQGTTGSTCLVVSFEDDGSTRVLGRGYAEIPQHFPKPGWVEHDLEEIWSATCRAISGCLAASRVEPKKLAAIGITNQRETTGLWDTSGTPVHRAIVWQDRRTADYCSARKTQGLEPTIRSRTGLVLDPYFSGTKLAWLLEHAGGLRARAERGELRFGTMDSWLVWRLTGGTHVTDATNASRTLLFDIHRGAWDSELTEELGRIPASLLPEVRSCAASFGKTRGAGVLPDGIPITGIAGDQHAALFGQACLEPGTAKCTYGTGAFALVNTGPVPVPSQRGLLTTIAWQLDGKRTFALEGSVFIAGAIVQWLRDGLGIIDRSDEVEALARTVADSGGVILVPALAGLGAPHWRAHARGLMTGITRGTTRAHLARAALEGIALSVYDLLDAMRLDSGLPIRILKVDGGAAANELLMQFQADLLRTPLHRPAILDTTALGAAYFAALGAGIYGGLSDVAKGWALERAFTPAGDAAALEAHVRAWHAAVAHA